MHSDARFDRRKFLKSSALAAGAVAAQGALGTTWGSTPASGGWKNGTQINPAIDNLRVAYVRDATVGAGHMIKAASYTSWANAQTKSIDQTVVSANMDKLAMALARKSTPAQAWATIFQKPAAKTWDKVTAAIKVNAYATLNPSAGVVNTLVQALHGLGIPYANITIFDNGATADPSKYTGNIQGAVVITHDPQGAANKAITVTDANGSGPMRYLSFLDNVDILISCAVCKSHDQDVFGKTSLALKNHVGTIWTDAAAHCPNVWPTQLMAMNKTAAIIGNPDAAAGVPPRQQLAVIDGIFAAKNSSYYGTVDCAPPGILIMGTLAGAVDYLTVYKVRIPILAPVLSDLNLQQSTKFLTEFGYDAATATALLTMDASKDAAGRGWVDALAYSAARPFAPTADAGHRVLDIRVSRPGIIVERERLAIAGAHRIDGVSIVDARGRRVRALAVEQTGGGARVSWDGLDNRGSRAAAGSYILSVASGGTVNTCRIIVE
jgi:hypothetical protein